MLRLCDGCCPLSRHRKNKKPNDPGTKNVIGYSDVFNWTGRPIGRSQNEAESINGSSNKSLEDEDDNLSTSTFRQHHPLHALDTNSYTRCRRKPHYSLPTKTSCLPPTWMRTSWLSSTFWAWSLSPR